jgi:hypothetical protein
MLLAGQDPVHEQAANGFLPRQKTVPISTQSGLAY